MNEINHGRRTLLVDNSNTRTKFTLFSQGDFDRNVACLPTDEISVESVRRVIAGRGWQYDDTLICSVVPHAADILAEAAGGEVQMLGVHSPMNVELDYPGAATLGADRIANVMAAACFAPLPCVVIDFGTAVTFDVLVQGDEKPRFIGGVIAPGLASMVQYLERNTALLPALEPARPEQAIGRCTEEALHAGSYYGYRGLVQGILRSLASELGTTPHIVATGGDASLLAEWLPEITSVCPSLTLQGLALAAEMRQLRSFLGAPPNLLKD